MEQRKVLIIILSITIILAATVGVGLLLYYPRDAEAVTAAADDASGIAWDPSDFLRGTGTRPGLDPEDEAPEETEGEEGDTDQEDADEDADADEGGFAVTYGVADPDEDDDEVQPRGSDRVVVIESPTRTEASTDDMTDRAPNRETSTTGRVARSTTDRAAPRTEPTAPATAPADTSTRRSAAAATPTAVARSTAAGPGPALADQAYWVQIISSPNRATIDQARRDLGERQMNTRILTKEIGGTVYYRLRFGPFALRTEAEKYLDWVLERPDFSDALIFVDYTTPVARPAGS